MHASPDAIATVACRFALARDGLGGEDRVQELVTSFGFVYLPSRTARHGSGVAYSAVS